MISMDELWHLAATGAAETDRLEFKCDLRTDPSFWCELLKDIVAIANSGGGAIVFGVQDDGSSTSAPLTTTRVDAAVVADKVRTYTGVDFGGIQCRSILRGGTARPVIVLQGVVVPLIFVRPGTYPSSPDNRGQITAFSKGTIYFRHGAKSEPGTSQDLVRFLNDRLESERKQILANVVKVVEAPPKTEIRLVPEGIVDRASANRVVLTRDRNAPMILNLDPNYVWPFRATDVANEMQKRLGSTIIKRGLIVQIRKAYGISPDSTPHFCFKLGAYSMQYSEEFIDWLTVQARTNPEIFLDRVRRYVRNGQTMPIETLSPGLTIGDREGVLIENQVVDSAQT